MAEKKEKLYTDMKLTVQNDSKGDIELAVKGEVKVVKPGSSVSGIKSDFLSGDLFRVAKIKGVDIYSGSKGKIGAEAPKEKKAPKE